MNATLFFIVALSVLAVVHAGLAAIVTRRTLAAGNASGLPRRIALCLAATTLLVAVPLAIGFVVLAEQQRPAGASTLLANSVRMAFLTANFGLGSVLVGVLASFGLRRLTPRLAAALVFVLLASAPLAFVVNTAIARHNFRSHWHCLQPTRT